MIIDVSKIIQLFGMYCNSFRDFLVLLSACLAVFVCFAIIKSVLRFKSYV